jgi:hypothetical protein
MKYGSLGIDGGVILKELVTNQNMTDNWLRQA